MDPLRTSEIDRQIDEIVVTSEDSDIESTGVPSDHSLDFSSGSGDDYVPDLGDLSDEDNDVRSNTPNIIRPNPTTPIAQNTWIRVYPPETEIDVGPKFTVRHPGPRDSPPRNSPPIVYALLFFTANFWRVLTDQTNVFANKNIDNKRTSGNMKRFSRLHKWANVTIAEMKKFFALIINMGLNGESRPRRSFWDTRVSQINSFFANTMTVNRFELIMSNLHLSSTEGVPRGQPGYDPWYKVRFFLDHFNNKFKKYFHPWQNVCIDESLIGMKNRCAFIMYMPNKKHKQYGIKKFECCDSKTNYVQHIELYSGKGYLATQDQQPFTEKVILEVMEKARLLDKGHHLFTDNYYTKVPLAMKLHDRDTFLTGTVNKISKYIPETAKKAKLVARQSMYFRQGNILFVSYKQTATRKPVFVLSTACHAEDKLVKSKKTNIEGMKPVVIDRYNQYMGGVDASDKAIYHNSCNRQTTKYWKKIFFNIIDIALFNAYVLYKLNSDKPMERRDFIISVLESLAQTNETLPVPGPAGDTPHSLEKLPRKLERTCVICGAMKKRGRSTYWCPGCNCGVHKECYHKLQHYWRPTKGGRKKRVRSSSSSSE